MDLSAFSTAGGIDKIRYTFDQIEGSKKHAWGFDRLSSRYDGPAIEIYIVAAGNGYITTADVEFHGDAVTLDSKVTNILDNATSRADTTLRTLLADLDAANAPTGTLYVQSDIRIRKMYYQGQDGGADMAQTTTSQMPWLYEYNGGSDVWYTDAGGKYTGGTSGCTYLSSNMGAGEGMLSEGVVMMQVTMPASQSVTNAYLYGERQSVGFLCGIGTNLSGANPLKPYIVHHNVTQAFDEYVYPSSDIPSTQCWYGAKLYLTGTDVTEAYVDGLEVAVTTVGGGTPQQTPSYNAGSATTASIGSQQLGTYGCAMNCRNVITVSQLIPADKIRIVSVPNPISILEITDEHVVQFAAAASTAGHALTDEEQSALQTFTLAMKAAGYWDKMQCIYPFVGGDAASHKFNLRDPRDADDAFRITFAGTVTHNSGGIDGDAATGYGDTHYTPSLHAQLHSSHIMALADDSTGLAEGMGCRYATTKSFGLNYKWSDNNRYCDFYDYSFAGGRTNAAASATTPVVTASRVNDSSLVLYENGSSLSSNTTQHVVDNSYLPTYPFYVLALNNTGTAQDFSSRRYQYLSIGKGLSGAEVSAIVTLVDNLQTALGR